MSRILFFSFGILIAISLSRCESSDPDCGQVLNAYDSVLNCFLFDSITNESIIKFYGSVYSSLGSKLLDENGNDVLISEPISRGGKMEIPIAIKGMDTLGVNITKVFYLHLVDHLNIERDIDTITVIFTLANANNCHRIDFFDFKCYYNERLYATEFPWELYPGIIFFK